MNEWMNGCGCGLSRWSSTLECICEYFHSIHMSERFVVCPPSVHRENFIHKIRFHGWQWQYSKCWYANLNMMIDWFAYWRLTSTYLTVICVIFPEADRDLCDWSGKKPLDYQKQMTSVSASTYSSEYNIHNTIIESGIKTMPMPTHKRQGYSSTGTLKTLRPRRKTNLGIVQRSYSILSGSAPPPIAQPSAVMTGKSRVSYNPSSPSSSSGAPGLSATDTVNKKKISRNRNQSFLHFLNNWTDYDFDGTFLYLVYCIWAWLKFNYFEALVRSTNIIYHNTKVYLFTNTCISIWFCTI